MTQTVLLIKCNNSVNIISHLQYNELFHIQPFFPALSYSNFLEYNAACYTACLHRMKQYHVYLSHSYTFILSELENQSCNCCRTSYFSVGDNKKKVTSRLWSFVFVSAHKMAVIREHFCLFPRSYGCDLRLSQPMPYAEFLKMCKTGENSQP